MRTARRTDPVMPEIAPKTNESLVNTFTSSQQGDHVFP
jgi:hypothetical protein